MLLPEASTEQLAIIDQLLGNNNVIVDSVAGSGKTTTNLHVARTFSHLNILLLTYNSKLRFETKRKVEALHYDNLHVHTYHSFAVKHYNKTCFEDSALAKITKANAPPILPFSYGLVVLDEAQDITDTLHRFICKIYKDNTTTGVQLLVFGDKKQCIYHFKKADQRYIEYAHEVFKLNTLNWVRCHLSVSFRITQEMANFINHCMLGETRIVSNKVSGVRPRYLICNCFADEPFQEIEHYLRQGYQPEDIFVLAPSVNNIKAPVRVLENKIKMLLTDVKVYVSTNDSEKIDESLIREKIVFTTFHQCKGLERKVVIVFAFDNSYLEFYNKKTNPSICPNELYVAVTRGLERLSILHHSTNNYLPFLVRKNLPSYTKYRYRELKLSPTKAIAPQQNNYVTDIIRFVPHTVIEECYNKLHITANPNFVRDMVKLPSKVTNKGSSENISDIIGIAIPSMFELSLTGKMSIYTNLLSCSMLEDIERNRTYNLGDINITTVTPDELFYISTLWSTIFSGYLFRLYQIKKFDWLNKATVDKLVKRLFNLHISKEAYFEKTIELQNQKELYHTILTGVFDCIDLEHNTVYEFKCVQRLEKVHYLQLAIYMYMYETIKKKDAVTKYVLYNITSNEYMEVSCPLEDLRSIVQLFIYSKSMNNKPDTDSEFIEKHRKYV
jgi:hypothetical protein